jgi:hypothetical protein
MVDLRIIDTIPDYIYNQIDNLENATFYHQKEWHDFLQVTFKWNIRAIVGFEDETLVLFLPFITKRRLFKHVNVSLPLSHKIGIAFKRKYDKCFDVSTLNLINFDVHDDIHCEGFSQNKNNKSAILDLSGYKTEKEIFRSFNKDSIQRKITKCEKSDIVVKLDNSEDAFNQFYDLQLETRIRQGSLMYPKCYFVNLLHCFKNTNAINLYGAFYENKMLAAVIFFNYKNVAIYAYGASRSDREMFKLGLNQAVMWEAIKHSYENQIKIVDFGSTPRYNKNLIDYKSKWNCTISDLVYSYYNPNNKKSKGINREGFVAKTISQVIKQSPSNIISKISPIVFKQIL